MARSPRWLSSKNSSAFTTLWILSKRLTVLDMAVLRIRSKKH